MKKLSLVAIFLSMLCVWPTAATARGLQKGDQLVSVFAGGAAPLQDAGIYSADIFGDDFANQELSWGEGAVSYGLQYMYALSPSWALGAEYNGSLFQEASYNSSYFLDEVYWGFNKIKTKMTVQNFLLAGRYTINPQGRIRFYIPLGVGLASASAKITASETICSGGFINQRQESQRKRSSSFSYYIGLGIEGEINASWVWGVEGRYQSFQFDYGKFMEEMNKKDLSYLSALFKVGYRF